MKWSHRETRFINGYDINVNIMLHPYFEPQKLSFERV